MTTSQKMLTEKLLKARKTIRKKFKALKHAQADRDFIFKTKVSEPLREILKPATKSPIMTSIDTQTSLPKLEEEGDEDVYEDVFTPAKSNVSFIPTQVIAETPSRRFSLHEILSSPKLKTQLKEHLAAIHGSDTASHLKKLFSGKTDIAYGVRYDDLTDRFHIGDLDIDMDDTRIIVADVKYKTTPGLLDLLFSLTPSQDTYTYDDLQKYKSILYSTNAHRRGYKRGAPVNANKSYKYRHIIAPLFRIQSASGLDYKPLQPYVDVRYWNNPKDLVERLQLLKASHQAGHTGHDAEIHAIEEELQKAGENGFAREGLACEGSHRSRIT